jgi:peptide/nickel transport system substrate-binding protein
MKYRNILLPLLFFAWAAHAAELRIALGSNFSSLDPHPATIVALDLSIDSHIYSSLIAMGPGSKLQPDLATSWKLVDPTTWRFTLRPGVKFPDGEALNSDVVRWNIKRIQDPKTKSPNASRYALIDDVKRVDDLTFDIITKAPFPALPAQLTMLYIMAPKWTESHNPAAEAMGTGPYELVEFKAGDRIVLKARPDYFGTKPDFTDVTFKVMPEASSRIAALLAGEVDFIAGFLPTEIARINNSGRATANSIPSNRVVIMKFNSLKPPFKDNNLLRQALNYAVDKPAIMKAVWHGAGAVSNCQILNPLYFGYNAELKPYPYDPAKAKALIKLAGYGNGLTVELEVPRGRYLAGEDIAQAVAAQLAEVGVNVKITEMEFSRYFSKLQAGGMAQMGYIGTAWPTLDADGGLTALLPGFPDAYYENETFVNLMAQARTETDPVKRKALYAQATRNMCENPPVIFLFDQPTTYGLSSRITWDVRGDDWTRAYDMHVKK